ncbi:MAG: BREX system ATP-binding domain-containing protein [Pseudomonadota bacterium]
MDKSQFGQLLENADNFKLRRTVERLREGLFDPFGVKLLTARETQLNNLFDHGSTPLCICGAYGQGKSHSLTYIRQRALEQGFVVSQINLDPREIAFHDFRQVYRALVSRISFPNGESSLVKWWKDLASEQKTSWKNNGAGPLDIIPESMPHLFRAVLTALAQENIPLSRQQRGLKKHAAFRPREFHWLLANALNGDTTPVFRLNHAMKYRQVAFYKDKPLRCKGWQPYFEAISSLSVMFQKTGLKGWVLLFDEGESIAQLPVNARRKSYTILDQFFSTPFPLPGIYPVFAFTDDFFIRVQGENYDRVCLHNEQEAPYFEKNYAESWRHLNIYRLQDLSSEEWETMAEKLIHFHASAYGWKPLLTEIGRDMAKTLAETDGCEARLKTKALVDQLDFAHQRIILSR